MLLRAGPQFACSLIMVSSFPRRSICRVMWSHLSISRPRLKIEIDPSSLPCSPLTSWQSRRQISGFEKGEGRQTEKPPVTGCSWSSCNQHLLYFFCNLPLAISEFVEVHDPQFFPRFFPLKTDLVSEHLQLRNNSFVTLAVMQML